MPTHTTLKGLVQTYYGEAFNVNRFEQSVCELQLCLARTAALPIKAHLQYAMFSRSGGTSCAPQTVLGL
jgi:hypothetical protein